MLGKHWSKCFLHLVRVQIAIEHGSELHVYHLDETLDDLILAVDPHHALVVGSLVGSLLEGLVLGCCQDFFEIAAVELVDLAPQDQSLHDYVLLVEQQRAEHLQRRIIGKF